MRELSLGLKISSDNNMLDSETTEFADQLEHDLQITTNNEENQLVVCEETKNPTRDEEQIPIPMLSSWFSFNSFTISSIASPAALVS